ncbi:hypothetical protein AOQ71_13275 [Bradyrhizobium manausense]|uniref:Uncharacterized protein n=1 Tax=Bradyrhizobium manausense TaxID=989370 RepID=A0A0R3E4Q1_9BRAD|nr:hypothetical protein AOQ71_13275 [Bradyrhizobium manausense]
MDHRRGVVRNESQRKSGPIDRLRDWFTGAGVKRMAMAVGALERAERTFDEIADKHRQQAEWTRLLTTAHEIHVKERRAPAAIAEGKMKVVQEARRSLQQAPRAVRWGPVALIAQAMRRVHYRPYVLAAEGEEAAANRPGRGWVDLWGIPRQGPRQ